MSVNSANFPNCFQSNERPKFNSTDTGNRRRYIEIPFDNVLKEDRLVKYDTGLKSRLAEDADVRKAVLAWIVAGCVEWRKSGLQIPPCVKAATEELFKQNDYLGQFFAECIVADAESKIKVADLRNVYIKHCHSLGEEPCKDRTFNQMISERGGIYKDSKFDGRNLKAWHGLKLSTAGEMLIETEQDHFTRSQETIKALQSKNAALPVVFAIDEVSA